MRLPFHEIDWRISAIMCSHVLGLPAMMQGTVYPKKYAHGFVVLCFVVVMQSFIMNSREVFIHIHQGYFVGTGAIVRLPQCQWSKPDGYGKISQYITTTKHSKAKTVCIFLGIYCISHSPFVAVVWNIFLRRKICNRERLITFNLDLNSGFLIFQEGDLSDVPLLGARQCNAGCYHN